jgi:hypothetical protein
MMKYIVSVMVALLIGAITVAAKDHVEQSNIVLIQGQQAEQIDNNTEDILSLTRTTESIDWKLELIITDLEDLECSD